MGQLMVGPAVAEVECQDLICFSPSEDRGENRIRDGEDLGLAGLAQELQASMGLPLCRLSLEEALDRQPNTEAPSMDVAANGLLLACPASAPVDRPQDSTAVLQDFLCCFASPAPAPILPTPWWRRLLLERRGARRRRRPPRSAPVVGMRPSPQAR